jgi:hypothetical protein
MKNPDKRDREIWIQCNCNHQSPSNKTRNLFNELSQIPTKQRVNDGSNHKHNSLLIALQFGIKIDLNDGQ